MTYHRDEAELGSRVAGDFIDENRSFAWAKYLIEDAIQTRARQALTLAAIRAAEEGDSAEAMQGAFLAAQAMAR